ncbi:MULTISPECIES: RDD family protein [Rhizobium]|uniref:RDD family protein n=1 Tax=Rhizobium laguerreae TaxID=1076926 RepID=A0A7Y2R2B1_9HYPH|nr:MULTISPECIES: RDD family protein [Rhizobium]MBY5443799.1 RDD family protein [Rhizobium leguminosarum]NNH63075.1 RDD family protein [Rhizobium laguerreae]
MKTWYYAVGQEHKGPITEEELHDLIKRGQIIKETPLWQEGMSTWVPAAELSEISAGFVVLPPLPVQPPPVQAGKAAPTTHVEADAKPSAPLQSRPWPRFWARLIDTLLIGSIIIFAAAIAFVIYAPDLYLHMISMNDGVIGIIVLPITGLVLAILMILTGTTPGKAIIGVRVPVPEGRSRFAFFLSRELKVWAAGWGLGIPFLNLYTQSRQYRLLAAGQPTSYDADTATTVKANPSKIRLFVGLVVVAALGLGTAYLRFLDEQATTDLYARQSWVNPINNKSAFIAKAWEGQEMKTNSGRVFYFNSPTLLAEALVGYERFGVDGITNVAYADAIKGAVAADVSITSDWTQTTVHGIPALRADGKSVALADTNVEVTVAVIGRNAWRTLVFARGRPVAQVSGKDDFLDAMFGTAD